MAIRLLLLFLISHLPEQLVYAATASIGALRPGQTLACSAYKPSYSCRCATYDINCRKSRSTDPCGLNNTLPCDESRALRSVISSFGMNNGLIDGSFCQNDTNLQSGAQIRCTCNFENNESNLTCHIIEINMRSSSVSGSIDDAISGLRHLKILDLSNNQLIGSIPKLGNLSDLISLDVSNNYLVGPIPNFFNLQNLIELDLSNNQLTGSIFKTVENLTKLSNLDISNNYLDGPIPNLARLQNLSQLNMGFNFFSEGIPPSLGSLSSLQILDIHSNNLSGPIPDELGNLTQLQYLELDDNELSGSLPDRLGKMKNLIVLQLTSNNLTGNIPQNYSQLIGLEVFAIGGNYLSGFIPDYIADWSNLTGLNLLGNNFEGIPSERIFKLPYLQYLWISDLRNNGWSLPKQAQSNITSLILRKCSINGIIPPSIANWSQLYHLDLSFNSLHGEVPQFGSNLKQIILTKNSLSGTFPSWMSREDSWLYRPLKADLSFNNFSNVPHVNRQNGTISNSSNVIIVEPRSDYISRKVEECRSKYDQSLSINCGGDAVKFEKQNFENDNALSNFYESPKGNWGYSFSGEYNMERQYLSSAINASSYINNLTCGVSVPEAQLYLSARVAPTSLTYYAFCLRKGEYEVKLYFAETLFSEKEDHSLVGKRIFDVYVQGKKVLPDFNIKKEAGDANTGIQRSFIATVMDHKPLQIEFTWVGRGSLINPPNRNGPLISAISIRRAPRKLSGWEIAGIVVGCVVALFILFAFLWRMGWIGDRELRKTKIEIETQSGTKSYSFKEIIDATRKFSQAKMIRHDHFGEVYKAELRHVTVEVKKLSPKPEAAEGIRKELYALSKLKNQNLVELLGYYSKRSLHLITYKHMQNGSLEEVIFDSNPQSQPLIWEDRYKICKQIALGLEFLHKNKPSIIHRNINAASILLDGNKDAKISDFGLAKLHGEDDIFIFAKAITTRKYNASKYMAPDYVTEKKITVKADVYSFGLLLFEIVSGAKIGKNFGNDENSMYLQEKVEMCQKKKKYEELIDEKLSVHSSRNFPTTTVKQATIIIDLAILCTGHWPTKRPTMSDVVSVLQNHETVEGITKKIEMQVENSKPMQTLN